jgi:uncharacterized membrane protein
MMWDGASFCGDGVFGVGIVELGLLACLGSLLLLALIVFVVWMMRGRGGSTEPGSREDRALSIARERLARGEITAEEYEQIARTLGS